MEDVVRQRPPVDMAENLPAVLPVNVRHLGTGVGVAVKFMRLDRIWKMGLLGRPIGVSLKKASNLLLEIFQGWR